MEKGFSSEEMKGRKAITEGRPYLQQTREQELA